jgi:hypothetical protein
MPLLLSKPRGRCSTVSSNVPPRNCSRRNRLFETWPFSCRTQKRKCECERSRYAIQRPTASGFVDADFWQACALEEARKAESHKLEDEQRKLAAIQRDLHDRDDRLQQATLENAKLRQEVIRLGILPLEIFLLAPLV